MFDTLLVKPIFNLLLIFYSLVGDFGVAILLFVLVVKAILYPFTKMQYDQMRRMRKIQPELSKIRKKYPDKTKQYLVTMALYKKNGIKTSRSMLSMIIQLPIIITIYRVIQMVIQSSEPIKTYAYEFVKNMEGVKHIVAGGAELKPTLFGLVDLSQNPFKSGGINGIILIIILAAMAYSQYKITKITQPTPTDRNGKKRRIRDVFGEAADGKEPDQSEMNQIVTGSMSKFMPIMMFVSFGLFYGALSFYYLISNLLTIAQYKYLDRENLPDVKSVDESEISERLRKAETAQLINEQRQRKTRASKPKTKTVEAETTKSGQRITRIKAKK